MWESPSNDEQIFASDLLIRLMPTHRMGRVFITYFSDYKRSFGGRDYLGANSSSIKLYLNVHEVDTIDNLVQSLSLPTN